jgi:hypothetical protein
VQARAWGGSVVAVGAGEVVAKSEVEQEDEKGAKTIGHNAALVPVLVRRTTGAIEGGLTTARNLHQH